MKYIQWKTQEKKKQKKNTRSGIEIFKLPILRNSIRIRTLLKLLLGFNSKTEQEKKTKKNTFPFKSCQKKKVYSKKFSYGFKYINTVFIHLVPFCKLIF